jgi:hypothetical protein
VNPSGPVPDFAEILLTLARHGVEFVIVGGVGAALHGATGNTFDLEIVFRRYGDNIVRLLAALREMESFHRIQPERRLVPDATHLSSPGRQLLITRFGPLTLLGAVGNARSYENLVDSSVIFEVGNGTEARVAGLADIIATKEEASRDKDTATLPILRQTLAEKKASPQT